MVCELYLNLNFFFNFMGMQVLRICKFHFLKNQAIPLKTDHGTEIYKMTS